MMEHITPANIERRIEFRYAKVDDLDALMAVYERFYDEAVYKDYITWDHARARKTIEWRMEQRIRPHIIAVDGADKTLIGFISWELDHTFSVRPVAILFEFYVVPEFRKGAIGRYLLHLAKREMKADGACAFHAPVASGMKDTQRLKNLLLKAGMSELGFIMRQAF